MCHKRSPRVPGSIPTGDNFFWLNLFCSSLRKPLLPTLPESSFLEKTLLFCQLLLESMVKLSFFCSRKQTISVTPPLTVGFGGIKMYSMVLLTQFNGDGFLLDLNEIC